MRAFLLRMPSSPDNEPPARSDARLARIEQALLDLMPCENRIVVLRRMLAALPPEEAQALLDDLRRRADADTWLEVLRDVA